MRLLTTYEEVPSLRDWLRFIEKRRRLVGMWKARHFPKKCKPVAYGSNSAVGMIMSGIMSSRASGLAQQAQLRAAQNAAMQQYEQGLLTQSQLCQMQLNNAVSKYSGVQNGLPPPY